MPLTVAQVAMRFQEANFDTGSSNGISKEEYDALYAEIVTNGGNSYDVFRDGLMEYLDPSAELAEDAEEATTSEALFDVFDVNDDEILSREEAHGNAGSADKFAVPTPPMTLEDFGDGDTVLQMPASLRGDYREKFGKLLAQSVGEEVTGYDIDLIADYIEREIARGDKQFKSSMTISEFFTALSPMRSATPTLQEVQTGLAGSVYMSASMANKGQIERNMPEEEP